MKIKIYALQNWYDKHHLNFNRNFDIEPIKPHFNEYQKIYDEIRKKENHQWYIIINNNFEYNEEIISYVIEKAKIGDSVLFCDLDYLDFFRLNKSMIISFSAENIKNTINYNFVDLLGLQKFISNIFLRKGNNYCFFKNKNSDYKIFINRRNRIQLYDHNIKVKKQSEDNLYLPDKKTTYNISTASNSESFDIILDRFLNDIPFTYIRFGDADYLMMDENNVGKTIGHNNRFVVTKNLHEYLIETHNIKDKNYLIGSVLSRNLDNRLYSYVPYLNRHRRKIYNFPINYDNLISAVTLPETFCYDFEKFINFPNKMNEKAVMFVGGWYHDNLKYLYGKNILHYINTPKLNSYSEIDSIYKAVLEKIDDVDVVILSTGQTSRIIANWLWNDGYRKTVIDVGSLSDYAALNTKVEKEINLRLNIRKNRDVIESNFDLLKYR